jgi:hypothetical protein
MYSGIASENIPLPDSPRTPAAVVILVVLFTVALPRLMLIGGLPTTDEGFQAYYAQIMHAGIAAGSGLPDAGPLMLYPLMVNWIFAFGANPMVALRLIDLLVAVAAGYALFRVIEIETRSRLGAILIAALFLFTMNQAVFIQYGFKNSIHAAYLPLFGALWLGLSAPTITTMRRWLGIGALLSVAVLLRETFLPLMALGALAVLISRGVRPFSQLVAGAFGAGVLITGAILATRGGITVFLESYRDAGLVYASVAEQRVELFFNSGGQALRESILPVLVAGVGLIVTLARGMSGKPLTSLLKVAFWLSAALLPLLEPATKIGFPYHFGVCLVGLAGLAALGWRNLSEGNSTFLLHLTSVAFCTALLVQVIPRFAPLGAAWPQTREVLATFKSGEWPEGLTDKTNYLLAAQAIRQATPPGGTVAVSGFMFSLYPLTGHLPPLPEFSNLSATLITLKLSGPRLREALLRCPPDVVMTTSRTDWPGSSELLDAVRGTGIYEEIAEIPITNYRAYGSFGGLIFRATKQFPCEE